MIGTLEKTYDYSILIDDVLLRYLSEMIQSRFNKIGYSMNTSDGASYNLETIEDVMSFSNPDTRKIIKITIWGNKEKDGSRYLPDISVSLFDLSVYDKSCILSLKNMDEQEILFFSQKVDEFVKRSRVSYWWINTRYFWFSLCFIFYALFMALYYIVYKDNDRDPAINIVIGIIYSWICSIGLTVIIDKINGLLFPKGGFEIGDQIEYLRKKKRTRKIVFVSIIGTIIMGVISGVITYLILP